MSQKNKSADADGVISPPRFRTAYDHGSIRVASVCHLPSRTKQEFKDQCDVNKIVANFMKTGNMDLLNQAKREYLDLTEVPTTYHEAMNLITHCNHVFSLLPASERDKYGNDVNRFLEAAYHDPEAVFGDSKPVQGDSPLSATTPADTTADPTPASPQGAKPALHTPTE